MNAKIISNKLFAIVLAFCFIQNAKGQVIINQPYDFLKWVRVRDSIRASIYFQNNDTLATQAYVRAHSGGGGGGGSMDTVAHDATIKGNGTAGNKLGVDTSKIVTPYFYNLNMPFSLAAVTHDGTLTGLGTTGVPLRVDSSKIQPKWSHDTAMINVYTALNARLSAVSHDNTLTGSGTVASPLKVDSSKFVTPYWFTNNLPAINMQNIGTATGAVGILSNLSNSDTAKFMKIFSGDASITFNKIGDSLIDARAVGGGGGSGVTSIGITAGYGIGTITGSPVTTSGNIGVPVDTATLKAVYLPLYFGVNKTIQQNAKTAFFTNGTTQIDSLKLSKTAGGALAGSDSIVAFGHSIMVGANSSPYSDSSFFARMGRFHGLHTTNKAVSGSVMFGSIQPQMRYINYPHTATTTYMSALNTVRGLNILTNRATVNSVQNGFKAMWLNHFAKTTIPAGDATVTRSGTWTTGYDANPSGAGKSANAAYTTAAGAYAEWTTTDSSIAVQIIGYNTGAGGASNVTISVDGVVQNTINLNGVFDGQGGSQQPTAFIYTGLSFASHTIRVTNVSGSQMIVDYFTSLRPASTAPGFVVYHDPRMNSTGYAGGQASDAAIDTLNAKIDSIMSVMPNPWRSLKTFVVKTENRYIVATGISSDGVHPNNIGHGQIAQAEQDLFSISASDSGSVRYSGVTGEVLVDNKPLAFKNNMGLQNILNNNSTLNASDTIFGSNTPLTFKNFSSISFSGFPGNPTNKGFVLATASGNHVATEYGTMSVQGANAGYFIGSRSIDSSKGFVLYSPSNYLAIYDAWKLRDIVKFDTSYRAAFINNTFNNITPTSTIDIGGNTFGVAGHSPLGIGVGALMATPENNKIENTGDELYYSDSSANSIFNFTRRKVETQKLNTLTTVAATPFTLFSVNIPTNKMVEVEFTVEGVDGSGNTAFMRRLLRAYNAAGTVTIKGGGPITGGYSDTIDAGLGTPAISAAVNGTKVDLQITAGNANSTIWTSARGTPRITP